MIQLLKISCFLLILSTRVNGDDVDILCTGPFCDEFDCETANKNIPDKCNIQNATHSGIFLPYPGPCNCCKYCLENLDEADSCTTGEPGQPPTGTICGNLLYCEPDDVQSDSDEGTCQKLTSTPCSNEQVKFDEKVNNGDIGHLELREMCDRRGRYEHYKCIPGEICYCRNEDNERIFGEIPFTSIVSQVLNCACSSNYEKVSKFLGRKLHVGEYLRCQDNGDYDTIQCIDEECFCVDAADGVPTHVDALPVNITEISNETLTCFNDKIHMEGEYYKPCELEYLEFLDYVSEFENDIVVIGASFPNCQLDGFYGPVQKNTTHQYCSDLNGSVLENFILSKDEDAELLRNMNCLCARARDLIPGDEKPQCLKNGNYDPIQCRRGFCRCVDKNGNQIQKELSINDPNYIDYAEKCRNPL